MSKVQSLITGAGILVLLIASSVLSSPPAQATTCYSVVATVLVDGSQCSGDVVIEGSVTGIGQRPDQTGAFEDNYAITNVVIPGSVTHVDYGAFRNSSVRSIRFEAGSSPVTINPHAIDLTASLQTIVLSDKTVSIGEYSFNESPLLKKIYIPSTVTSIDITSFSNSGLTDMVIAGNPRQIFIDTLTSMTHPVIGWVPAQHVAAFTSLNPVGGITFQAGNGPAPTIYSPESNTVINSVAGEAYSLIMSYFASGNSSTTVSAGSLPPGLQLNQFGHLMGTPTTAGSYNFALMVTDIFNATTEAVNITINISAESNQSIELTAYEIAQEREAKEAKARLLLLENLAQGKTLTLSALISAGISITSEATAERVSNNLLAKRLQSPEKKLDMSAVQGSVSKEIVVEKLAYAQSYAQLFPRDFVLAGLIDQTNPYKTRILIALRKLDTASLDSLEKLEAEIAKQGAVFETRKERLSKIYARR